MQRLRGWLAAASLVAGFLCGTSAVSAQTKVSSLIVPGKSVGGILLGTKESEVSKKLRPAQTGEGAAGTAWSAWFTPADDGGRGAEVDVRSGHTVDNQERVATAIRLESAFFHTKEGVSTQSSLADIWKVFPELRYDETDNKDGAVEYYADALHGIGIEVRRTKTNGDYRPAPGVAWGVCQAIIVFQPSNTAGMPTIRSMRDMPSE